jgi:hypothetical protein
VFAFTIALVTGNEKKNTQKFFGFILLLSLSAVNCLDFFRNSFNYIKNKQIQRRFFVELEETVREKFDKKKKKIYLAY